MFLPIGSVVLLKGMNERTLIFGRCQQDKKTKQAFDYVGCSYPQGIIDSNNVRLFNAEDIQIVFALGYQDTEEFLLRAELEQKREKGEI